MKGAWRRETSWTPLWSLTLYQTIPDWEVEKREETGSVVGKILEERRKGNFRRLRS